MTAPSRTRVKARSFFPFRRYREVAAVLVKYGLVDVLERLHLRPYLTIGSRLGLGHSPLDPSVSRAKRLRLALEELGPTFVKFGQALSTRPDVLPSDLVAELSQLQDHVAPLEPGAAEATIEAEFQKPVDALFRSFETTPLAAASIAQVHRAQLPSGEDVVVKVRRPGIGDVIANDIAILRQLAHLVERHVPEARLFDPSRLVDEFARTIRREQDLVREGRNIESFARNFTDDPTVRFPCVYWSNTTPAVLTLEFLDGVKISDLPATDVGPRRLRIIARRGADAVLTQILIHGMFHADPHPGNILVLPHNVIGFLDFGIVGRLDERMRQQLTNVIRAVWQRDTQRLATLAMEIAEPQQEVNVSALRHDLEAMLDAYGNVAIGDLSMNDVLTDVVKTVARHHLRFPSNLMLLVKAVVTIEGVGRQLDPTFKIIEHAAPLAEQLWAARHRPSAIAARLTDAAREAVEAARGVPADLGEILRKIRDDRLQVQFVHRNLEYLVKELDRSSNRLSFAIVIGALIVGSSLVMQAGVKTTLAGYPALGLVGFIIAAFLGMGLAIGIVRSGRL